MLTPKLKETLRTSFLEWYDAHRRDLPWRRIRDPYAIWLSEVMLQQTQVATVIPYWERFLQAFPTVESLAKASLPDVLSQWRGLGYYSRARNLQRAAHEIVSRFQGQLPRTIPELLSLPGFGRYTAGAVASIAFGQEAPVVDGNVARVFSRLFEIEGAPGDPEREKQLWSIAENLVPGNRPGDLNQALMELGATLCRLEAPLCLLCPVRDQCQALRKGRIAQLPPRRVRAPRKRLTLAAVVWRRGKFVLLARRKEKGLFGGLWELPTVEISEKMGLAEVAEKLRQTLGNHLLVGSSLGTIQRTLTHRTLHIRLFSIRGTRLPKRTSDLPEFKWATREEASNLGISTAMQHALALIWKAPTPVRKRLPQG